MKNKTILLRIEPETKAKITKLAELDRRSMTSFILNLIDKKLIEVNNGTN
jgi:uncharacterized protein (DUF1778 family)